MKKKIKNILNEFIKWKPPVILVLLILFIFIIFVNLFKFGIDSDFWFLVNIGEYILDNGLPTFEPFTMHQNLEFIVQQWLTDIIFYTTYSKFGVYGLFILTNILSILIVYLIYKLSMLVSDKKVKISIIVTIIISTLLSNIFITTRPQIFDIILLLSELYLLELYVKNNNKKYLMGLPIISLLMINLHSSLWLMIFVFLLPYYAEKIIVRKNKYELKPIIITTIIMALVGLINPYGISSITYLFNSYGVEEINNMVLEMIPLEITSSLNVFILIFIVLFSFYYNKGNNKLRYFFLTIGTCYLGLSHYKGVLYFILSSVLAFSYNFKDIIKEEGIQTKFYNASRMNLIIIIVLVYSIGLYSFTLYSTKLDNETNLNLYEIANYLDENASKDINVYTGYNDGAYLEYRGYKCYMDARAEVFLKSNNKKEDIIIEYYNLQYKYVNYKEFLDKYNFDYLVLDNDDTLYTYFENTSDEDYKVVYEKFFEDENVTYRIYKKVV